MDIKNECKVLRGMKPSEIIQDILNYGFNYNFRHYDKKKVLRPETVGYYFPKILADIGSYTQPLSK